MFLFVFVYAEMITLKAVGIVSVENIPMYEEMRTISHVFKLEYFLNKYSRVYISLKGIKILL